MSGPAAAYAQITAEVQRLIDEYAENDIERAAYMVARASLVVINSRRGGARAAEVAYKLADEFAIGPSVQTRGRR